MISLQLELSCSLSFPSLFLISLFPQERYLKKIKAICQGMQRTPSEIPNINNLRRHLSLWSRSTTDICSSASAKPPWHIQVFLCCLSSREDRDNDTTTVKELTHALHTPVFFYTANILEVSFLITHGWTPSCWSEPRWCVPTANRYSKYTTRLGLFQSKAPQNKYRMDTS